MGPAEQAVEVGMGGCFNTHASPAHSVVVINETKHSQDAANIGDLVKMLRRNVNDLNAHKMSGRASQEDVLHA